MARYFMHLRNGIDEVLDPEGVELSDIDALRKKVITAARDILVGDLRNGVVDLRYRVDAENEGGEVIYTLAFKNAFSIIPEAA